MSNTLNKFSQWDYQVIALAGVAQSAALVQGLASYGTIPERELQASVNSLLVINPASVADVYPNVAHLGLGLRTLQTIFTNERARENADLIRYTLGMLILRGKLMGDDKRQQQLREKLAPLSPISSFTHVNDDEVAAQERELLQQQTIEQLAKLYQDIISTLPYRIQVQGKIEHLKNEATANQIRALLLAGIRSAVLWYQLGGRRWRLLLHRKRILHTAGDIRRKLLAIV